MQARRRPTRQLSACSGGHLNLRPGRLPTEQRWIKAKNEVHASLQRRLQAKPPCSDLFGVKGRKWLARLMLPAEERESVDAAMRHVEFLDAEIAAVERLIAQQALSWPEIRRLMTVPGAILVCAASFVAAVGDPNRFLTSASWSRTSGLTPASSSPVRRRRAAAGSQSAARRPRAGRWSKRHGPRYCNPARCTASTSAPKSAAGTAKRSSRPRASSPSCSGAWSPEARTTPTSNPP